MVKGIFTRRGNKLPEKKGATTNNPENLERMAIQVRNLKKNQFCKVISIFFLN